MDVRDFIVDIQIALENAPLGNELHNADVIEVTEAEPHQAIIAIEYGSERFELVLRKASQFPPQV